MGNISLSHTYSVMLLPRDAAEKEEYQYKKLDGIWPKDCKMFYFCSWNWIVWSELYKLLSAIISAITLLSNLFPHLHMARIATSKWEWKFMMQERRHYHAEAFLILTETSLKPFRLASV